MKEIRHHQQAIGGSQQFGALLPKRQQLVEGIELHELDPGLGWECLFVRMRCFYAPNTQNTAGFLNRVRMFDSCRGH